MNAGRVFTLVLLAASVPLLAQAGAPPAPDAIRTGFLAQTITVGGFERRYVLYVPRGYRAERPWPLIVFLNGAGECGTDGWKQVGTGLGSAIMNDVDAWPFLVLFPQKPDRASAWEDHDALVMAMLARSRKDYAVDDKRLFLTGLSQGGHGTWVLGARHADVWAAIAPVCGYGDPGAIASALKNMPIWCFHGEDDKAVPVKQSKDLCAAVEKTGGHAELTLYPGTGHNSWDKAYRESPLAEWLMMAATDRIGARYVARPDLATTATVVIRDEWIIRHAHDRPSSLGTTTATLQLTPTELSWRIVVESRDAEKRGPAPEPRTGKMAGAEGKQLLARHLRALQTSRVFRLPAEVRPAPRAMDTQRHAFTIDVSLDGQPGSWRFRCELSADAAGDQEFGHQQEAVAAFFRAIGALN